MSAREWKPGDVALVEVGCWANRKVALRLTEGWSHENGVNVDGDGVISVVRPLVVIDPEDREAVERLLTAIPLRDRIEAVLRRSIDDHAFSRIGDHMQEALRELADPKPPKPEEPMGLGAVVEDVDGHKWVRIEELPPFGPWYCGVLPEDECSIADGAFRQWADIDAVKVLSEGVTGGAS